MPDAAAADQGLSNAPRRVDKFNERRGNADQSGIVPAPDVGRARLRAATRNGQLAVAQWKP